MSLDEVTLDEMSGNQLIEVYVQRIYPYLARVGKRLRTMDSMHALSKITHILTKFDLEN